MRGNLDHLVLCHCATLWLHNIHYWCGRRDILLNAERQGLIIIDCDWWMKKSLLVFPSFSCFIFYWECMGVRKIVHYEMMLRYTLWWLVNLCTCIFSWNWVMEKSCPVGGAWKKPALTILSVGCEGEYFKICPVLNILSGRPTSTAKKKGKKIC